MPQHLRKGSGKAVLLLQRVWTIKMKRLERTGKGKNERS